LWRPIPFYESHVRSFSEVSRPPIRHHLQGFGHYKTFGPGGDVSPGKVAGESPAGGPSPTDPPYPSRDSMICYAEATDCCRRTKNTLRSPGHRSSGLQRLRCLQRRCLERSAGVVDHHRCCPPEPPAVSQGAAGPRHHRTPDGGDPPDGVGQRPRFRCTGGMGIGGRRGGLGLADPVRRSPHTAHPGSSGPDSSTPHPQYRMEPIRYIWSALRNSGAIHSGCYKFLR